MVPTKLRAAATRLFAPFLAACLGGCSWLFVNEAPEHHERMAYFECTSSKVAPVLDTVGAAIYGVQAAVIAGQSESSFHNPEVYVATSLAVALVDAASAMYGYRHTSRCADAKSALAERTLVPQPSAAGCSKDSECKGARICVDGRCMDPEMILPAPLPPPPPPAASEAAPSPPPPPAASEIVPPPPPHVAPTPAAPAPSE